MMKILEVIKKKTLLILGIIFTGVGIVGILVPILPTTPFLLLAAACFLRSSDRFHKWLLNNRFCGSYIRNYLEGRGMPLKTKVLTILVLWTTILITIIFWVPNTVLKTVLILIAVGVTIYISLKHSKITSAR